MLYNDRAVLENHHISAAFRLMKEDEFNVLSNLKREEYRLVQLLTLSASNLNLVIKLPGNSADVRNM